MVISVGVSITVIPTKYFSIFNEIDFIIWVFGQFGFVKFSQV